MLNKEDKFIVITVADVMTSQPRCVGSDVSVEEVINIFSETNFAGLPVIDEAGTLVGIVTQYDLVTKGSGIHIPTLVKTMEQMKMIHPERMILEETLAPIKKLLVKDIMNNDPLSLVGDEPIEKAVESFAEHHKVNPLIVVDKFKKVIGVLSRHDLIKILAMKELGKAVDSAYGRNRPEGESEQIVGEALKGIKKNFLFMPRYGVGKWVGLGVSIFVIGLVASFLFIVKIPDLSRDVENIITATRGEARLSLVSNASSARVGDMILVNIYVNFSGDIGPAGSIFSSIYFDGPQKFIRIFDSAKSEDFISGAQIFNLKTEELTLIWDSPMVGFVPRMDQDYYLGTLEFEATGKGLATVNFDIGDLGGGKMTFVEDLSRRDILKEITQFEIVIE